MALVLKLQPSESARDAVHGPVEATFKIFKKDGQASLQIDTFGSSDREKPGKQSQTIQFGPDAIAQLREILSSLD